MGERTQHHDNCGYALYGPPALCTCGAMADPVTLEPCLYCGGKRWLHENDWADPPLWSWRCSCGVSSKEWPTPADAAADANRSSTEALVKALREAAEQFEMYAREHWAKANTAQERGDRDAWGLSAAKARTNDECARKCRTALHGAPKERAAKADPDEEEANLRAYDNQARGGA